MNRSRLRAMLMHHECIGGKPNLKPYKDSRGKLTIGIGRCLETNGISEDEAQQLCDNDITRCVLMLPAVVPSFGSLNSARQHVLVDMAFNLGVDGLRGFKLLRKAIAACEWEQAAAEMLNSEWAKQVPERAAELAAMMKSGVESGALVAAE